MDKIAEMLAAQGYTLYVAIAAAVLVIFITILIVVRKNRKKKLKEQIDALYVRFNDIKTVPIAFKLAKAQTMAKRSEETSASVADYYAKYEETEKHINELQELLNNVDDGLNTLSYKEALESLKVADFNMVSCEKEIREIDEFLEGFTEKENEQREFSVKLKEKYRIIKNTINKNSQLLSIAYEGFVKKLQECEELFTVSEEAMFGSDYGKAQDTLEDINNRLEDIKKNANAVPKLVKDSKGVLPIMLDETKRELALTRQRGIYTDHLEINEKLAEVEKDLNEDIKNITEANTSGIKKRLAAAKDILNELNEQLVTENKAFKQAQETNDLALQHLQDMEKVEEYVRTAYRKDSQRFGLMDLDSDLDKIKENIGKYRREYGVISGDLGTCTRPASQILTDAEDLYSAVDADMKALYSYKTTIDKSTDGEIRANSQLTKLQLVVCEVESKLAEYSLPSIDESYKNDLLRSRQYIEQIRTLLNEVPIDVDRLNGLLSEAIDFIYRFYNDINNVVGMCIMVENAIVFGNKYRSTYPEIDRELSKAEFQYLNGEYTKALKTAITCMETLFPESVDERILENYQ